MKKSLVLTTLILVSCVQFLLAQPGLSNGGKKVEFTFPVGVTSNKTYLFPTFDLQSKSYASTVAVSVTQVYTYIDLATMSGNTTLTLTFSDYILPGAIIYIHTNKSGSNRTLTIQDAQELIDESVTISGETTLAYIYTGDAIRKMVNLIGPTGATGPTGPTGP